MTKKRLMLIRIVISLGLFFISFLLSGYLKLCILILSYACISYDIIIKAVRNIIALNPLDENFLMTVASAGAFLLGEYTEGCAVMIFYQIGESFQSSALAKSRRSIKELMDIQPEYANIEKDGIIKRVCPEEVEKDDIIVIKPGEKIALDGVIVNGSTSVDTSAITGEALPRYLSENDEVISGCVNLEAVIKVRVTGTYENSTATKIIETVENCTAKKSKSEKFITKFARIYTPAVVICALIIAVIPVVFGADFIQQIRRALIFLVVSCPCALVISVPLTFFGAIGGAARRGILIKGSEYIDRISKAKAVALDKTGTLTQGSFKVSNICAVSDENELLKLTAYAEVFNEHPIAKSLKSQFPGEIKPDEIKSSIVVHGGVKTDTKFGEICVGNRRLMDEIGASVPQNESLYGEAVYTALDGRYIGHFIIEDTLKPSSKKAVEELKSLGINKIAMLTGDTDNSARRVADELGINEIYSSLLPHGKVEIIEKLQNDAGVIFMGDGINDAPVLARSDVGVSMGLSGSGAAIEASDAVILSDDPMKICELIRLSRKTMRIVRQNIVFALVVKIGVLLLGAVGISTMWEAVFADVGVCIIVVLNAMRMLKK